MSNYIQNNYNMIKMYNDLYDKGMDIDGVKNIIFDGCFDDIPLCDFYRFRIFLDSCLLLFNKEKIENDYLNRKLSYKKFISNMLMDSSKKQMVDFCEKIINENTSLQIDIQESKDFYYSFSSTDDIPEYKQLKILRNSFAHMQYGNFACTNNGIIVYYGIYNKDKGIRREVGIIVEPIMHYFIETFYSNNIVKGIPYKHTFVTNDVNLQNEITTSFWEIRYIGNNNSLYNGYGSHIMKENIFTQRNRVELTKFLSAHNTELKYDEKIISKEQRNAFCKLLENELGRKPKMNEFAYTIKAFYDIETEFSNFLVHLIQLNDRIIDYKIIDKHINTDKINDISASLDELKEDIDSWVAFKYFFILLECINVMLRLEEDDLSAIKRETINIDGFQYECKKMVDYINLAINNSIIPTEEAQFGDKYYIIERFRNALAHGNIKLTLDSQNHAKICFNDKWNQRDEKIEIQIEKLRNFLSINDWHFD